MLMWMQLYEGKVAVRDRSRGPSFSLSLLWARESSGSELAIASYPLFPQLGIGAFTQGHQNVFTPVPEQLVNVQRS